MLTAGTPAGKKNAKKRKEKDYSTWIRTRECENLAYTLHMQWGASKAYKHKISGTFGRYWVYRVN